MRRILFISLGNGCRGQLAAGLARHHGGETLAVFSAGVYPVARVSREAVMVLAGQGIEIVVRRPGGIHEFTGQAFDDIVTLGDSARQAAPFLACRRRRHWDIADPAAGGLAACRRAGAAIEARLREMLAVENA